MSGILSRTSRPLHDVELGEVHPWRFGRLARSLANLAGRPVAFIVALFAILVWAATGPLFGFSDTWQLIVNTSTTIITFLMVFIIQNTQNRDTAAIQIKLDELIRATQGAHNALLDLEELDEDELREYLTRYEGLAAAARDRLKKGRLDTGSPEVKPAKKG
jgi:low affinity Fe/Cu permease